MSDLDIRALETNFEAWRKERVPHLPVSTAFERYAIDQIFRDWEPSDEEVDSGITGGSDDGGIDAVYLFVNDILIQDGTELPDPALSADLYLIQAKYESGFSETAVEKMYSFTRDLLDYAKPVDQLTYLNTEARDAIARFREKYDLILGSARLTIRYYYVTKSDVLPNPKVVQREQNLKEFVHQKLSQAIIAFSYWGCRQLLTAARSAPQTKLVLPYTKCFDTIDGCVVALVELKNFANVLKDEKGELKRSILEPNVRDYQGKGNLVNIDIRRTLQSEDKETDFWWLNNGITVIADDCSISAGKLVIEQPEIVNGLQTTQEVFNYFSENPDRKDSRNVLVRIIVPPKEKTRNDIIKATNNQTAVNPLSLHATEPIHFDIEERLGLFGLFYDRRKGHYKHLRKPMTQIVSQKELTRSVIAILLQRPDDARARPQSLTNKEEIYKQIFNEKFNRDLYVTCVLLDRQVEKYLNKHVENRDVRGDIRFYVDMLIACELAQKAKPTVNDIAALMPKCVAPLSEEMLSKAVQDVSALYLELIARLVTQGQIGSGDKVAKGTELKARLVKIIEVRFPEPEPQGRKP